MYIALLGFKLKRGYFLVERFVVFIFFILVLCCDQTYSTFGSWRCPLHLMSQQVSIASSESLNNTKLFPFHLHCVVCCHFEIRHILKLNSPSLSLRNLAYLLPMGGMILSVFHFFLSLQQWFQWDQFVKITSLPLFLKMQLRCDSNVVRQSFSPLGTHTPELILYWVPTSWHKSLMDCKA